VSERRTRLRGGPRVRRREALDHEITAARLSSSRQVGRRWPERRRLGGEPEVCVCVSRMTTGSSMVATTRMRPPRRSSRGSRLLRGSRGSLISARLTLPNPRSAGREPAGRGMARADALAAEEVVLPLHLHCQALGTSQHVGGPVSGALVCVASETAAAVGLPSEVGRRGAPQSSSRRRAGWLASLPRAPRWRRRAQRMSSNGPRIRLG